MKIPNPRAIDIDPRKERDKNANFHRGKNHCFKTGGSRVGRDVYFFAAGRYRNCFGWRLKNSQRIRGGEKGKKTFNFND